MPLLSAALPACVPLTKRIVSRLALFGVLTAFAGWAAFAQQAGLPTLYVSMAAACQNDAGTQRQPVPASNNQRIPLKICLRARTVEEAFEPLSIAAQNQGANFFQNRPGPSVTLSVKRIGNGSRSDVRFRVNSSGGGKDLTVHFVYADLDILEDQAVRDERARQFAAWMTEQAGKEDPARASRVYPQAAGAIVPYFEEQYVNNPPGDYEIVARYAPTTAGNWKGSLVSKPFLIHVVDQGDFFEKLKAQLSKPDGK
ncbi:MAG TPA: hypothetical protein VGR73_13690 [Bryobacteraceae bacterium]|nr:hypothetical protein [Bryobacteraceae bacterium]